MTTATNATDEPTASVDKQLGSPVLTFESGWLVGLVVGLAVLLILLRRRSKRRCRRMTEAASPVAPSMVA
jgi:ABC-type xylose transport system permease subunit